MKTKTTTTKIPVVGVSFSDYKKLPVDLTSQPDLVVGMPVSLVHVRNNKYDRKAVAVELASVRIGWLPMDSEAQFLAVIGNVTSAAIASYNPSAPAHSMFTLSLTVEDDGETSVYLC